MKAETSEERAVRLAKRRARYHANKEAICARERKRRSDPAVRAKEKAYREKLEVKIRNRELHAKRMEDPDYTAKLKAYRNDWYQKNRERELQRARDWALANPDRCRRASRRYANSPRGQEKRAEYAAHNKPKISLYKAEWYQRNKTRLCQKQDRRERERSKTDPSFRLAMNFRARTRLALSRGLRKVERAARYEELWGCSPAELVEHLEKHFLPGMTWENHGEWHVDHIEQLYKFDLTDTAQRRAAFHFTNLRPLWAEDNLTRPKKG